MTNKIRMRIVGQVAAATAGTMLISLLLEVMGAQFLGLAASWKHHALALMLPMIITPLFSIIYVQSLRRLSRLKRESEYLATIDPLSGLINRRAFFQQAQDIFSRSENTPTTMTVLIVDIDRFKSVNDSFGHGVGDAVIKMVARAISNVVKESADGRSGVISRFGGDEFVILAKGLGSAALSELADCLCDAVRASVIWRSDLRVSTTVSIGIAIASGSEDIDTVLRAADGALYEAKGTGRDRWCVAIPDGAGLATTLSPETSIPADRKVSRMLSAA